MKGNTRRSFVKKLGLSLASLSVSFSGFASLFSIRKRNSISESFLETSFQDDFSVLNDRVWIGEKYWAVPMEDWQIKTGRLEFKGSDKFSRVNLLTKVIKEGNGTFTVSTDLGLIYKSIQNTGAAGFSIGVKDKLDDDVRAACYYGESIKAGVSTSGALFISDKTTALPQDFDYSDFNLTLAGEQADGSTLLTLRCKSKKSALTEISYQINEDISGLVALTNNFEKESKERFWFKNFSLKGSKIVSKPQNSFGPILWTMHTLSNNTLRIMAQMPPIGLRDNQYVDLFLKQDSNWKNIATQPIDETSYTAHFKVDNWDSTKEIAYRVVYKNQGKEYQYNGVIREEPRDRPLKFGGLTCQEWGGYPYTPLVKNLKKHNPDMLYFSGDQLYEGNGGYKIKREPDASAILSYLGKWYMFGWTFGDVMRDRPTICTPDDHDVFQGNLWGEGGIGISVENWGKMRDSHGGFIQTPKMVNVVGKTNCGHLPEPYHSQPLNSGIKTWHTDLVYGNVSFAIISDRMFKSGPELVREGSGRIDHIKEPLKLNQLEDPNLELLGKLQMEFLEHWINKWEGATMKVLLSQTLFCNVGTHHGEDKMFLHGDMDSGGWPKQKRDDAIRLIRKASAFHINGDQHLPFMVQYSLDEARDAGWTFCTPAISTGYIRWGEPDAVNSPFTDRPAHGLPNTGVYKDVFSNTNYIYAVGNPKDKYQSLNRYQRSQNKSSGFGLIIFNTAERTIKMDAYRFLADKDKPTENDSYPGWPLTISQSDNDGRKPLAYLPQLKISKTDQVVKIINEKTKELINVIRIKGSSYQPGVFADGTYTVIVGEGKSSKELKGIKSSSNKSDKVIKVNV
ncbi:MAG: alkaline phosphatase D family protein [Daejeonella sp.]